MYANIGELAGGFGSGSNSENTNNRVGQVTAVTQNSELDSSFGLPRIDEDQLQENNANTTTFNSVRLSKKNIELHDKEH